MTFEIPPLQLDPRTLPPPLLTSESGSFAYNTLEVRIPRIVADTIESNSFPADIRAALEDLRAEIVRGCIQPLREETPDRAFWNTVSREWLGRAWREVPWYWAEAFFYRRALEATRYFQPGAWHEFDPYAVKKASELQPHVAPQLVNATLRDLPEEAEECFEVLLYSSLWGNRTDLSYNVGAKIGRAARLEDERVNLLVDDAARVWALLRAAPRRCVALIADNAGTELSLDCAWIDFLLRANLAARVLVYLKTQPFFVSDALPRDFHAGVAALARGGAAARALAERMRQYLNEARLELRAHWFFTTCLFYFQLPADLRAELAACDLVILKGDANYRRLLGDAHWAPTTPFARATAYFPAPLVALRTLKAELIVGLREGEAERLRAVDPEWMVNGRRGVVQANLFDTHKTFHE